MKKPFLALAVVLLFAAKAYCYEYVGSNPINATDPLGLAYGPYPGVSIPTTPEEKLGSDIGNGIAGAAAIAPFVPEISWALASRFPWLVPASIWGYQLTSEGGPSPTVTVGRWMSEAELLAMRNSGRVVESTLNGVTSVTCPADPTKWMRQTQGTHFVEFDVPSWALRASDGLTAKIFGPNSIFGPKLGITQMPPATNIRVTAQKP